MFFSFLFFFFLHGSSVNLHLLYRICGPLFFFFSFPLPVSCWAAMIFFFLCVCVCNQALLNGYLLGFSDTMFEKLGKFFFFFVCSLLFSMFSVFPWFSLQLRAEVLFFHYPTVHVLTRKRRHPVKAPICSRRLSFLASMIVPLSALGRRRGKKKKQQ